MLWATLTLLPVVAHGQSAPPPPVPNSPSLGGTGTAIVAVAAGIAVVGLADHALRDQALKESDPGAQHVADAARPLGTPTVLGPALLLGAVSGVVFRRPGLTHASVRIAAGVATSAAACGVLKLACGRLRPDEAPGDPDDFVPFSGHDSFPSGHTTVAFAAAAGIDRETTSAWVPWVVYPIASLVGWSRIHDDKHWTSDVVAGAALGIWTTNQTQDFIRRHEATHRLGLFVSPGRHSTSFGLRETF